MPIGGNTSKSTYLSTQLLKYYYIFLIVVYFVLSTWIIKKYYSNAMNPVSIKTLRPSTSYKPGCKPLGFMHINLSVVFSKIYEVSISLTTVHKWHPLK